MSQSVRQHNIAVAQLGARMHYAVPRILHEAGMLSQLYTDICVDKGLGRVASILPATGPVRKLKDRTIDGVPDGHIVTFSGLGLEYYWRREQADSLSEQTLANLDIGKKFCAKIIDHGLGNATHLYSFNSAGLELMRVAKRRGIQCIVEQTVVPKSMKVRLMAEEYERFPGWMPEEEEDALAQEAIWREEAEWELADLIVAGSTFVKESIEDEGGPSEKVAVVPYGVGSEFDIERKPANRDGPLRVLFAGNVRLRKGIGDVVRAARELSPDVEIRAAGTVLLSEKGVREVEKKVTLLGRIPRSTMIDEYRRADALLLPSIWEGSATVIYEALFAGLPVITTFNAGSVVRDGKEGFIVFIRSPEAIAERLYRLMNDPDLRMSMGRNAKRRAKEFTVEKYGERLIGTINAMR